MINIKEIKDKYSNTLLTSLNKDNVLNIVNFLEKQNCNYIEDLILDYLDLFTIDYSNFIEKYNKLNKKYDNDFLNQASLNMDLLEEFFE